VSIQSLVEELKGWISSSVKQDSEEQKTYVQKIAADLNSRTRQRGLSRVDLVACTRALAPPERGGTLGPFYLLPVAWTWLHLFLVFREFRQLRSNIRQEDQLNFLTYWSGGNPRLAPGLFSQLHWVAIQVVILVAIILVIGLISVRNNHRQAERQRKLIGILARCQVELAHSGPMTPEEVTDTLGTAVQSLESAVVSASGTMKTIEKSTSTVSSLLEQLGTSSAALVESSRQLAHATSLLDEFPRRMSEIVSMLTDVASQISEIQRRTTEFERATSDMKSAHGELIRQGRAASEIQSESVRSLQDLVDSVRLLHDAISGATNAAESAARKTEHLSEVARQHEGDLFNFAELFSELNKAIASLGEIGVQFEQSAAAYRELMQDDDSASQVGRS